MWVNGLLFQAVWFTCILGSTVAAVLSTASFLVLHLYMTQKLAKEVQIILVTVLLGFSVDMAFSTAGFIQFQENGAFPYYLLCLWLAFATTLYHSSSKLLSSNLIALIGGALAPLSYFAAQNMGKVSYTAPLYKGIILHALLWAGIMLIIRVKFFKKEISSNAR
ncbi:MAG: DUF2878 domain-containing protein [Lentisphaerales bacterium]|nr:DUF2878 domain-containing protein [Lentisphaerales bacterium]